MVKQINSAKKQFTLSQIQSYLTKNSNPKKALFLANYLRAEYYGLGDKFLGLTVPDIRNISKKVGALSFTTLRSLINSRIHEERFLAVINLITQFQEAQKSQDKEQTKLFFEFYIKEMLTGIDNWDLVDVSADKIVGAYLIDKPKLKEHYLYKCLVISPNLWHRRIAIVATFHFIKKGYFTDTIKLAELLLNDPEDLIHKSVGWMLREMGKKHESSLIDFLDRHYQKMPRIMLRYSLERLESKLKVKYLKKYGLSDKKINQSDLTKWDKEEKRKKKSKPINLVEERLEIDLDQERQEPGEEELTGKKIKNRKKK